MLQLRRIRASDLEELFVMRNDPEVYRWCRQYAPLHWDRHLEWYEWQAKDPKTEMFSIFNDSVLVGVCGLTDIDYINRRAEFSLYIGRSYQNLGLGKKSLIELFRFGFNTLGLNRIWGESFDHNPAIKIFESIGMELDGVRRDHYFRNGNFICAHLYSISAANFKRLSDASKQDNDVIDAIGLCINRSDRRLKEPRETFDTHYKAAVSRPD